MRILARPAFSNRAVNPYNWLLYTHMLRPGVEIHEYSGRRLLTGSYDIWHLHWPESSLNNPSTPYAVKRVGVLITLMEAARRRGTKIVWTIHNLAAHEEQHPHVASWFWRAFIPRIDGHISLSAAGQALALERFPGLRHRPGFVVPIGHFRDVYSSRCTRAEARAKLGIDPSATVAAFVGQIRPYKNVPALIHAFRSLPSANNTLRLIVAGDPRSREAEAEVRAAAEGDARVRLFLGFVPEDDLHTYVKAADLLIFPFKKMLNSASALLALSLDRPILVPALPTLVELQRVVGTDWVRTYDWDLTAKVLQDAMLRAAQIAEGSRPSLAALGWPTLAGRTLNAYEAIVNARPA